jgi:hypothetical protein
MRPFRHSEILIAACALALGFSAPAFAKGASRPQGIDAFPFQKTFDHIHFEGRLNLVNLNCQIVRATVRGHRDTYGYAIDGYDGYGWVRLTGHYTVNVDRSGALDTYKPRAERPDRDAKVVAHTVFERLKGVGICSVKSPGFVYPSAKPKPQAKAPDRAPKARPVEEPELPSYYPQQSKYY